MDKQSSPNNATTVIRNITIGVITSVLAATVIYYLGYNKDEKAEFKKRKEATIRVWGTYRENLDIASGIFDKLANMREDEIEIRREQVKHEMEVAITNMENVKKEPGADTRVYSTIDLKAQQLKEAVPIFMKFYDDILVFKATNPTEQQGEVFKDKTIAALKEQLGEIKSRDSFRLAKYYEGLNKDYDITLPDK
jgi:membrane-associated HD superfamily phosphohydrolase